METTSQAYQWVLLALTLWREARGCPDEQKRAIAHVIANRATDSQKRFGKNLAAVLTAPLQFTSISPPRSNVTSLAEWLNATVWPQEGDPSWAACCQIADAVGNGTDGADPTGGATNYYSEPIFQVPNWAKPDRMTLHLGPFRFYKL